jgi:hypothetical protein
MRRVLSFLFLAAPAAAAIAQVGETRGTVVYDHGCGSRIVLRTPQGYIVARLTNGAAPSRGNTLVGRLDSLGIKEAYNVNSDGGATILIEGVGLSQKGAAQLLNRKCR